MPVMGRPEDAYNELLDAAIRHLEGLRARGVRFVPVSTEVLRSLGRSPAVASRSVAAARAVVASEPAAVEVSRPTVVPGPISPPAAAVPTSPVGAGGDVFGELRPRVLACTRCPHLVASRTQVVFGVGNPRAELMFVGEAPGAEEDVRGEPFVGAAGQLLTRIIQAMGLSRETVYIANILKCRPDTPGQASGNRKPTSEEMRTCLPYLQEQIDLIRPRVLVGLGATAIEGLLGKTAGIGRLRGQWQQYRGIPLMPTYHPAYLLRNQAPAEKRRVWEDMLQVMEKLGLPVSEKQRGYFLKPSAG